MSKYKLGDLSGAIPLMRQCLDIMHEIGDKSGTAMTLTDLGNVVYAQGDLPQAARLHRQALHVSVEVGDKRRIAFCLEGLAAAIAPEQPARAAQLYSAADGLRQMIGTPLPPSERADYDTSLSRVHSALGDDAYSTARAAGLALSLDQAVAFALATP
jgi:hypothetical protein